MLSKIPADIGKVPKRDVDAEILRTAIIAELDAVSLYEQMANMTDDQDIKKVLLEVAREEKTHVGEFQALLLERDKQQEKELQEGKREVEELTR